MRQRYYDTSSGRFTRRDTHEGRLSAPLTLHKYLYANNNPLNYTDPSGLFASAAESNAAFTVFAILATIKLVGITTGSYNPERLGGFGEEARPKTVLDGLFAWKNTWSAPTLGGIEGSQPSIPAHTGHPAGDIDDFIAFVFPYDTTELRKNMSGAGRPVSPGDHAHHIVPGKMGGAAGDQARAVLDSHGIDINNASNGVALARDAHLKRGYHRGAASQEILRRIENLPNSASVQTELEAIGREMQNNTFKF